MCLNKCDVLEQKSPYSVGLCLVTAHAFDYYISPFILHQQIHDPGCFIRNKIYFTQSFGS